MKKTCTQYIMGIVLFFLLCFSKATAQTIPEIAANNRSFSQIFDSLSTGLIPSRIPYGILMDRVYGWSRLEDWTNGDTVKASRLFQTWYDAEEAYMNPANRPANYLAMRDTVDQMIYEVKLPVVAFTYQFGYIDSFATQDGRLSVSNGMLTDNNNALPYISKQVNMAGLATEDVFQNKSYLLYFDQSIVFNNTAFSIQNITVLNLTTNSQFVLTVNNGVAIQFVSSGVNTLRFTIQLSNGSSYTTHQRINVKPGSINNNIALRPVGPNCTPVSQLLTSTIPFQGYNETTATNSHADVHYYFHTISPTSNDCERVLRKPIIIVDGFDPQNERKHYDLYDENLAYLKNGTPTKLGDELRDKGFDVIILNFPKLGSIATNEKGDPLVTIPNSVNVNGTTALTRSGGRDGGADYIERNAMLLIKLIQEVNATLAANGSTEKIVIVGPSMGGLISRYALAYMEKQQSLGVPNMNHNCRVWVSFDSPHDGANISTGVQNSISFLGYTVGDQNTRSLYEKKLKSIAAQQQMIQQSGNINSISPVHIIFYTNIKNNGLTGSQGFPQTVRRVNLLNGNGKGINTYSPGEQVLSGDAWSRFATINIKGFDIEIFFSSLVTNPGQFQQTSYNFFINKKRWFSVGQSSGIYNIEMRGSMDAVQGSVNNEVLPMLYDSLRLNPLLLKLIQNWYVKDKKEFCFIPTISALGFKQPVANWHTRVDDRNLLCNNEINFDSYFLAPTNEKHIFLTEANVNWVMQEIEKGQPNCPTICSYKITGGAATLCENETATYTLDVPAPAGYTVQWNVPAYFQLISSTNNAVTVKAIVPGTASIKAVIVNPCGANAEISTAVTITGTTPQGIYFDPEEPLCINERYPRGVKNAYVLNPVYGAIYEWRVNNIVRGSGNPHLNIIHSNCVIGTNTITVRAFICGVWSTETVATFEAEECEPEGFRMYSVSPNPSYGSVSVESKSTKTIDEIRVKDKLGNVKLSRKSVKGAKKLLLDLSLLPADIYFIEIFDGKEWHVEKVIKN